MKHCSAHTGYCGLQFWLKYMYFSFSWRHERVFLTLFCFMNSFKMGFPLQDIVTIKYFLISHANISLYIPRPKQIQTKDYIYTLHRTRLEAYILGPVLLPTLSWYPCVLWCLLEQSFGFSISHVPPSGSTVLDLVGTGWTDTDPAVPFWVIL